MRSTLLFPTIRQIKSLDIHPRKRHGQNFLIDKNIALKVLHAAQVTPEDTVIEIGSGLGSLTFLLHDQSIPCFSYEIDKNLYDLLSAKIQESSSVKLFNRDILKVSFPDIAKDCGTIILLGSIPYSLTTPILLKFLEESSAVKRSLIIMQKEVAERICARPGTKEYGILSVYCTVYLRVAIELIIPPDCFFPVPKVDSALVRLIPLQTRNWNDPEEFFFRSVVRSSFSGRRKTIFNCLKSLLAKYRVPRDRFHAEAARRGLDLSRRAETFTAEEFQRLTASISSLIHEY